MKRMIFLILVTLVLSSLIFVTSENHDGFDEGGGAAEKETGIEVPVSEPENIPNAVYTPQTNDEEASLDVTEVEEAVAVDNYQGQLTGDGWGASATYNDAIFDRNGIYQATITGIAAGASYYIISTAGDHVLRYTASEEESSVRKIVINAGAETWITVIMEEGDSIESGESKTELPYIFTAQGFYNVTLSPETEYRYIYDTLNLSLENTDERKDISICKGLVEEMTCDVQNK